MAVQLLDAAGRRRSPATMPGYRQGCPPRNKGMRPGGPAAGGGDHRRDARSRRRIHGARMRALIVVLWRAGLRIHEALILSESDLDPRRGAILVRRGKGGKRREVGMDDFGWEHLTPWIEHRIQLPVGALLCVIDGPSRGRAWSQAGARTELRHLGAGAGAGVRRRLAPHQLRHAHAVEMAREGVPLPVIQRQLRHAHLGITSTYLQGIDTSEIIETIHARRPPMLPASAGLRL